MSAQDEYMRRVREVLGGQRPAVSSTGHGIRALYRCGICGHVWLMDGPREVSRPSQEQLTQWASELHADLTALPVANCRICGAQGVGEIGLDEYGRGMAYGISWEGVEPPGAHMIVAITRVEMAHTVTDTRASVITDHARFRAVLRWLARVKMPDTYDTLTPAQSAEMALDSPPGHRATGTDNWVWRGAVWFTACPPMGGRCVVSVSQALPPEQHFSVYLMLAMLRALASMIGAGHIAGEEGQGKSQEQQEP